MTRGILIAGTESSLSAAIAVEAARRVETFAGAFIPNRLSESGGGGVNDTVTKALIPLIWNPGSPISARSLTLAAENRLERIHEAILVCAPPSMYRRPEELISSDIDTIVNDYIKGWFFLVKELTARFKIHKSGTLVLVLSEISGGGKADSVDLAGPPVAASFRALAQGVQAASIGEPYDILTFSSSEAGEDPAFAAFVFKTMEENNKRNTGKWHKFGKLGLFGR
ncbi:MAG: hypothetical protein LBG08_00060 [Spirochaetaceae bacterium]|jgi:hypothetical protein|nr:hypothetical protein [Spirochaetaceae bacterium]